MNSRPLIILAVLVVAICGAAAWFLQSSPPPAPLPVPPPLARIQPQPLPKTEFPQVGLPTPPVEVAPPAVTLTPLAKPPQALAEWEVRIDEILRANPDSSDAANSATAQNLINLLPSLPPEGQAEAAQHISNLITDKDYNRVAPLVKNASLPADVLDVFVTDLMNRDDAVKLPMLLEVAKIPNHPNHEEAATDLQIFLDDDFGTNWTRWEGALKDYLKKQAQENADSDAAAPAER